MAGCGGAGAVCGPYWRGRVPRLRAAAGNNAAVHFNRGGAYVFRVPGARARAHPPHGAHSGASGMGGGVLGN